MDLVIAHEITARIRPEERQPPFLRIVYFDIYAEFVGPNPVLHIENIEIPSDYSLISV